MTEGNADDLRRRIEDLQETAESVRDTGNEGPGGIRPIFRRMSDVEPRKVESLWPGYIVAHKFNLLAGYGGVGKGQLMCNLIGRGSTGSPMPTESAGYVFRTLILAAEDDAHEDIRPRLDANGANTDNVFVLDGVSADDGVVKWVDIKQHITLVEGVIKQQGIDLLYIDPLSSYMPGVTRRDAGDVRDTLGYIQRLINNTGVTVVGTLHLGKSTMDRKGAMKILDSVEFVNAARNVLAINDLPDEHQPQDVLDDPTAGRRKVLGVVKANSTIPGPPLSFSRPLDAAVVWHGVAPVGFDESFNVSEPRDKPRQEAKDWLWDYLKGGMKLSSEVKQAAENAGIKEATLRRAREDLGVESKRPHFQGPYYWALPGRTMPVHPDLTSEQPRQVNNQETAVATSNLVHMAEVSNQAESPKFAHMDQGSEQPRNIKSEASRLFTSLYTEQVNNLDDHAGVMILEGDEDDWVNIPNGELTL